MGIGERTEESSSGMVVYRGGRNEGGGERK